MSHLASPESIEHAAVAFWDQSEEDLIPIDIVAEALGIGRNSVKQIDLPAWGDRRL